MPPHSWPAPRDNSAYLLQAEIRSSGPARAGGPQPPEVPGLFRGLHVVQLVPQVQRARPTLNRRVVRQRQLVIFVLQIVIERHIVNRNRRLRVDAMIAGTATLLNAKLATNNQPDFAPFVAHGLALV